VNRLYCDVGKSVDEFFDYARLAHVVLERFLLTILVAGGSFVLVFRNGDLSVKSESRMDTDWKLDEILNSDMTGSVVCTIVIVLNNSLCNTKR